MIDNEARWKQFSDRLRFEDTNLIIYSDLASRYTEPQRYYHTLRHIDHCLEEFEQVRDLTQDPNSVEMALWYHDAIYDRKPDDEERSAQLAMVVAANLDLPDGFDSRVSGLILATKHRSIPQDPDTQVLIDIDLAILGQSDEVFDEYERNIRKEYDFVPEEAFIRGRLAILEPFSRRDPIYSTLFFQDKYELRAHQNLARSISRLQTPPKCGTDGT